MTANIEDWQQIAAIFHEALPEIDKVLSQANVPVTARSQKAFDIVQKTMLEVSDYEAFLLSEAHGRLLIIVDDWYKARYGDAADSSDDEGFGAMVLIHGTPFPMWVPRNFKTQADEPNTMWIGFPASVQAEEDPLQWVENKGVVKGLSQGEKEEVRKGAKVTANLIRSIQFDLRALEYEPDADVFDLAGAIGSDLQASARHLCERTDAGLRSAEWDASQATEKALKLFIRRKGQTPPFSHDLEKLAACAELLSASPIDRGTLAVIPSNRDATDMRYGGAVTLSAAKAAYEAALPIIRQLLFEARPDTKYNVREARFKIQQPPWFDFDTESFRVQLRSAINAAEHADHD